MLCRRPSASHVECKMQKKSSWALSNPRLIPVWLSCFSPVGPEQPTPTWLKWILRSAVHAYIVWPRSDAVVPRAVDHLRPVQISILSHIAGAHSAPSALSLFITDISAETKTQWPTFYCCDPAWPATNFIGWINQEVFNKPRPSVTSKFTLNELKKKWRLTGRNLLDE